MTRRRENVLQSRPRHASKDPHQGPWTTCGRCGFIYSGAPMRFQYDYNGGPVPQNQELLVCPRCEDAPSLQQKLAPLRPDPAPFRNTRVEPYAVDETDWITTEDGEIIETESDQQLIEDIPNPDEPP